MSVRKANCFEQIEQVMWLQKQNLVDYETLSYPTTERFGCEVEGKRVAYMHHHASLVLESIAFSPDSTPKERLESASELLDNAISRAKGNGLAEIYYISSDPRTDETAERMGFTKVSCYRKKVSTP